MASARNSETRAAGRARRRAGGTRAWNDEREQEAGPEHGDRRDHPATACDQSVDRGSIGRPDASSSRLRRPSATRRPSRARRRILLARSERTHACRGSMRQWSAIVGSVRRRCRERGRRTRLATPRRIAICSIRRWRRGGSSRDRRSRGCTPTRRCSSVGCGRCCCSRCIRWRWPGVAEHSDYRSDPWGRLQRTADFLAATTFGPAAEAERAIEVVRRVHEHVVRCRRRRAPVRRQRSASAALGAPRRESTASSPPTSATALDPLRGADRDEYVAQTGVIARALGVPAPPESPSAGCATSSGRSGRELQGTPAAREAAPLPAAAAADAARRPAGVRACSARPRWR